MSHLRYDPDTARLAVDESRRSCLHRGDRGPRIGRARGRRDAPVAVHLHRTSLDDGYRVVGVQLAVGWAWPVLLDGDGDDRTHQLDACAREALECLARTVELPAPRPGDALDDPHTGG